MFTTTPSCTMQEIYGDLPPDNVPDDVDLYEVAKIALTAIQDLHEESLTEDAIWRDWLSLSGRTQTFCGIEEVFGLWRRCVIQKRIEKIELKSQMVMKPCPGTSWVSVGMAFNTVQDNGLTGYHTATIGLVPTAAVGWKVWTIATVLETFAGYGHPDEPELTLSNRKLLRPNGVDYSVAIVGGGQCGIALAGRLKALDIPAVIIERGSSVGQAWTTRYDSIRQHTSWEYNNLPFDRMWTAEDEELLSGKSVAKGFERFVARYRLEVWTSTEAISCLRDDENQTWTINLVTRSTDGTTHSRAITSRHLVAATGSGFSHVKLFNLPGREFFKGTIMHQGQFRNAKDFSGKRAIVIGSDTTGHDIAQDSFDNKMSVTMIQRSRTPVYPLKWVDFSPLWNGNIPTTMADRIGLSGPQKVGFLALQRNHVNLANEPEYRDFFDALEKAGFKVARNTMIPDIFVSSKWGTFYIDVGTSKHIIAGDVRVKSGIPIKTLTDQGILFEDGEELPADLIVTATGHEPDYRRNLVSLIGEEMAGRLPEFWGTTKNGDLRGFMQEARPGFWMIGGNATMARWMSRFIALQMMLDLDGVNNVVH